MARKVSFDVLKNVMKIAAPIAGGIITAGGPIFLGPAGAPVAALANVALGAAAKLAETAMDDPESATGGAPANVDGYAERALLAEASLQAVVRMDSQVLRKSGTLDEMEKVFKTLRPRVEMLAPHVLKGLIEPALKIALAEIREPHLSKETALSDQRTEIALSGEDSSESAIDPRVGDFMQGLLAPTQVLGGEESFFDTLGKVLNTAVHVVPPILGTVNTGMNILGGLFGGAESGGLSDQTDEMNETLMTLGHRAIMGEAALQALMTLPRQQLEEEGMFDSIKQAVQKIGQTVIKAAPGVIRTVGPIVLKALAGAESDLVSLTPPGASGVQPAKEDDVSAGVVRPRPAKRSSLLDMLNGDDSAASGFKDPTPPATTMINGDANGDHVGESGPFNDGGVAGGKDTRIKRGDNSTSAQTAISKEFTKWVELNRGAQTGAREPA